MSLLTNILFNLLNARKIDNNNSNDILKNAPTAENIDITIDFNYWKLLLFLFPNSFKDDVIRHLKLKCLTHKMINFKIERF